MNKISPSCLNIDNGRIGKEISYKGSGISQMRYSDGRAGLTDGRGKDLIFTKKGRYPSQLLIDNKAGKLLDKQSGDLTSRFSCSRV